MSIIVRPISLRDTLLLKYNIVAVYRDILNHADLPYTFDELKKPWWRYYGQLYGFSYSRVHRSYDLWISNGLKRNIRLFMPFLMKMPSKKIKTTDTWKKRTFLYKDTTNNSVANSWNNPKYFKKINLTAFNIYNSTKEGLYYNFPGNKGHYSENPSGLYGLGNENIFSGFNGKWHNTYKYYAGFYKLNGMAPTNNLVGVNDHYMWTGLFINLYDTTIALYPQNFLNYYNNIYIKKIKDIVKPFFINIINSWTVSYYNSYFIMLSKFNNILIKEFNNKIYNYSFIFLNYHNKDSLNFRLIYYYYIFLYFYLNKKFININNIFINLKHILYLKNNSKICNNLYGYKLLLENYDNYKYLDNKYNFINYLYLVLNKINGNLFKTKYLKFNLLKNKFRRKMLSFNVTSRYSLDFINYYRGSWTVNFLTFLRNKKIYIKFLNKYNYYKKYKFSYISQFSLLSFKKRYNLGIKRILSYGKLFLRVPSTYIKRRLGFTKLSALIASKTLFRTFLFSYFNKFVLNRIAKFTFNIFFVLNLLIKLNFGLSYSLLKYNKINIDNYFYLSIENYLSKFLYFLNNYLKNKSKPFVKGKFLFFKLFLNILNNNLTIKSIKNIKKLFRSKLRYLDFCYKGISLKLFKKKKF